MPQFRFDLRALIGGFVLAILVGFLARDAVASGWGVISLIAFALGYVGVLVAADRGWLR